MRRVAMFAFGLVCAAAQAQDDYSFDVSQYERKPWELSGYAELRGDWFRLDPDAALYRLNFLNQAPRDSLSRGTGAVELGGVYRYGMASLNATAHGEASRDPLGSERDARLYEGYARLEPSRAANAELGKRALRWGKGYAWNPVGFVERPKDPNDPELSREGHVLAVGEYIKSFGGPLRTLAVTPLLVPTGENVNEDFGPGNHANPAAKLYLLYYDTDIDFMVLGGGSRSFRYGVDFARNITTNFEVHGEWARISDFEQPVVNVTGAVTRRTRDVDSFLLGARYLSERDLTTIVEYYRNGTGYSEDELREFYQLVHGAYDGGNTPLLTRARDTLLSAYGRPNAGRRYLYLRLSQKEPFDILYFAPALTIIANLDDGSRSIAPEIAYTGITNLELRLRAFFLMGDRLTEFGEKQNDRRVELRARYYF